MQSGPRMKRGGFRFGPAARVMRTEEMKSEMEFEKARDLWMRFQAPPALGRGGRGRRDHQRGRRAKTRTAPLPPGQRPLGGALGFTQPLQEGVRSGPRNERGKGV